MSSRKEGIRCGGEVRVGRRAWGAATQAACTETVRLKAGGPGHAHRERVPHGAILEVRYVEAQRLVERHRVLPSRKEGIRCGVEVRARRCEGVARRRRKQRARGERA